jgi:hypothetical protein
MMLSLIQSALFNRALEFRNYKYARTGRLFRISAKSFGMVGLTLGFATGLNVRIASKNDTKATARCIPLEQPGGEGKCISCGSIFFDKSIFLPRHIDPLGIQFER